MNKTKCAITKVFPTLEDLKKVFFIDLDKQTITRISTNNTLSVHKNRQGYLDLLTSINSKRHHFKVHRLFFYWKNGYLPKLVDHKDRNPQNNKIENLRELSQSENNRNSAKVLNSKRKPTSKYKNVGKAPCGKKWQAQIRCPYTKKNIYIGSFEKEDDAGQAVNNKIRELGLEEVSVLNDTPQERARKSKKD
jgi:hypothetical protein